MRRLAAVAGLLCAAALLSHGVAGAARYTLIVLSHSNHTVYELDPDSGHVLHTVVVPGEPHEAAISPDGHTIYVTLPMAGFVSVIDARTFRVSGRIDSPSFKRPAVKGPDGKVSTSAFPHGIALTDDGATLYVGVERAVRPGLVAIDLETKKTHTIDVGFKGGHSFQIQPGSNQLFYPFRSDNTLLVLDTADDRKVATIPVKGGPVGVGFAPNGDVWVQEDGDGSVTIVNSFTDKVTKVVSTGGKGAGRMAVSPSGQYAASTHSDSQDVTIFNARTRQIAGTVHTGRGPSFPVFSADSTKLFVMNSGEGDVAVIDVRTRKVTARWKVGTDPFGGGLRYLAKRSVSGLRSPVFGAPGDRRLKTVDHPVDWRP